MLSKGDNKLLKRILEGDDPCVLTVFSTSKTSSSASELVLALSLTWKWIEQNYRVMCFDNALLSFVFKAVTGVKENIINFNTVFLLNSPAEL